MNKTATIANKIINKIVEGSPSKEIAYHVLTGMLTNTQDDAIKKAANQALFNMKQCPKCKSFETEYIKSTVFSDQWKCNSCSKPFYTE